MNLSINIDVLMDICTSLDGIRVHLGLLSKLIDLIIGQVLKIAQVKLFILQSNFKRPNAFIDKWQVSNDFQ